ncbi:MAG: hypothetical protein M1817_004549, partial [Caeruleum heppii]
MAVTRFLTQSIQGIEYYVHPEVVGHIQGQQPPIAVTPSIVVTLPTNDTSAKDLLSIVDTFSKIDDVYSHAFNKSLILQKDVKHSADGLVKTLLSQGLVEAVHFAAASKSQDFLPSGPYFLYGQQIHQAWRLYPDELDAFVIPVVPENPLRPSRFRHLNAITANGVTKQVAVPSRLYQLPSKTKPLGGKRVSVKDNYGLAGIQTTMMSNAYTETYPPETEHADYVDRLMALGAFVVGKTKMSSFAGADEPTDQWIDFHCPTNPRGDRYQSPSGSSTGAAAALAGYSWLDYSVGTDTAGSIRAPATCNGVYALRSSLGSTSTKGIVASSRSFDVVGLMGRDLQSLHHLAASSLDVKESRKFPTKILYPTDLFPHSDPTQQAMVDQYVAALETYLGTKCTKFSLIDRWAQCPPHEAGGKAIKEYLSNSGFGTMSYEAYHQFDDFRRDYRDRFRKEPYVGPIIRFRWDAGKAVTPDEYERNVKEQKVFRDWFRENVLSPDSDTLSDAIMIVPNGRAGPKYRDDHNGPPSKASTLSENYLASVLQLPHLVLPIGQKPYTSRISGNLEHRPIVGSMIAAKGSDLMLIKLAEAAFQAASWPTRVLTGRYTFELGKNVRNVEDQASRSPALDRAG